MNDQDRRFLLVNRIDLFGEVGREMGFKVREALMIKIAEGSPNLTIHISSGGGEVTWGLDIYDAFRFYPGKKVGIVHGIAASMAAIILQGCDWRVATHNARILIHHISSEKVTLDTLRSSERRKRFVEGMESDQKRLYEILLKRTGKKLVEIRKTCRLDMTMSAEEAKAYGLIDQIITSQSEISIPK